MLKHILKSFETLCQIARHPQFSQSVHALLYSSRLFGSADIYKSYEEWFAASVVSGMKYGPEVALKYQRYCMQVHSEHLVQIHQDLSRALAKLPRLIESALPMMECIIQ